ncbi:MAG: hypothetical protein AAF221_14065 [Pseudomonadota bacterium]
MSEFSILSPPAHEPVSQSEAAGYLKLEQEDDADLIAGLIRSGREACELYTGQALLYRDVKLTAVHQGQRFFLRGLPVVTLLAASWTMGEAETALEVAQLATCEQLGRTYVDLPGVPIGARVSVSYRLGLGADWNSVPETLRLGILRLIAHQYENRSKPALATLPGAVTALWQPYRQVHL